MKKYLVAVFAVFLIVSCDMVNVGLGESVDIVPPEITIETPAVEPMVFKNDDFTITGTVNDDIAIESVVVTWSDQVVEAEIDGTNWSLEVPFNTITQRGQVLFSAVATDTSGKETLPALRIISIDNNAPTVLVKVPQSYNSGPENSNYIVIGGEVWDISPIEYVRVNVFDPSRPSFPVFSQNAEGDRIWSTRVDLDGAGCFINSESYVYQIEVKDVAGNINNYEYHSSDFWSRLPLGENFPVMSDIGLWDQDGIAFGSFAAADRSEMRISHTISSSSLDFTYNSDKDKPHISLSNLDSSKPVSENSIGQNIPIYASAVDDKEGIDSSSILLNITNYDGLDLNISASDFSAPGDGLYSSFKFDLSGDNILLSGQYDGVITLSDKKGVESTLIFSFLVNKGNPVIVSISPNSIYAGEDEDGNIKFEVEIKDDNPGSVVTANITDGAGDTVLGTDITVSIAEHSVLEFGETMYSSGYTITIPGAGLNSLNIVYFVTDTSGLKSSQSVSYSVDRDNPSVVISVPGPGHIISGNAITAAGTSSDAGSNVFAVSLVLVEGDVASVPEGSSWDNAEGNTTWSLPLDLTGYTEGDFTLFAKALDIAGNEGDIERVLFYYDLSDPVISIEIIDEFQDDTDGGYELSGGISDTNRIERLEIKVARDGGVFNHVTDSPFSYSSQSDVWSYKASVASNGDDDGIYEYEITVFDIAGKSKTITKNITVDTSPPNIVVSNLIDGDFVSTSDFTVLGLASDLSGVESAWYSLNGGTWNSLTVERTGNWELPLTGLTEGAEIDISFKAIDYVGLESAPLSINFGLDLDPPALEIINKDTYNDTWQKELFTLSGTTSDENGVQSVLLSTDGGASYTAVTGFTSGDETWTSDIAVPSDSSEDGNHVIKIKAVDTYNKETFDTLTVKFDTAAPTFNITNLVDNQLIRESSYILMGSWSDNGGSGTGSGMATVEFELNNTGSWVSFSTISASVFANPLPFIEGIGKAISFRAIDALGNISDSASISDGSISGIDVDIADPLLIETSSDISDAAVVYRNADIPFAGTATDGNGIASVTVNYSKNGGAAQSLMVTFDADGIDNIEGNVDDDDWSASFPAATGEGSYEITITATDGVGRASELTKNIIIDTVSPVVNFKGVTPVVGNNTVNQTILWSGSVSDETAIDTVQYQLPGGVLTDVDNKTNWEVSGIDTTDTDIFTEDSNNDLTIVAVDRAGNTTNAVYTIYVDQDSDRPSFSYINVDIDFDTESEASGNLLETGAKIQGTISDDDEVDKDTIEVEIYNTDDSIYSAWDFISNPPASNGTSVNWTHDLSSLSDGVYYALFRTNDTNGLTEITGKLYFTVDLNPAALVITSPSSGTYQTSGLNITGTASDANGLIHGDHDNDDGTPDVDYIQISPDSGTTWINIDSSGGTWSYSVSAPVDHSVDGAKSYLVRAIDVFGKSSTLALDFTIDTTFPELIINSPVLNSWTNLYTLSVGGASDDTNGVVSVESSLDGSNWTTVNGTVTWNALIDITGEADQENKIIYFRNTDIAGNVTTDTRTINIDRVAPTLSETEIGTGDITYKITDYTLGGTLADNLSSSLYTYDHDADGGTPELAYVEVIENNGAPYKVSVSPDGDWSLPVTFVDGTFSYEILITDKSDNSALSEFRTIIADNSNPSLDSIISPTGSEQFISGSAYTISGSASDSGSAGLSNIYWWVGPLGDSAPVSAAPFTGWNTANGLESWTGSIDLSLLDEGDNTVHVLTVDHAGNISNAETVNFMLDQTAPVISNTIITPRDDFALTDNNVSLNKDFVISGTVTETNGFQSFELQIDDGLWNALTLTDDNSDQTYDWSYSVDLEDGVGSDTVPDGSYEYRIRAVDNAGRSGIIVQRNVFVDTDGPVISYINLDSSSVVNGEIYNVMGTATDTLSTIRSVTIAVNGPGDGDFGAEQTVSGSVYSWNYNLDLKPSGTYYADEAISIRVTSQDSAGNITQEAISFTIDQEDDMPILTLSGISPYVQGAEITVSSENSILTGVIFDEDGVDLSSLEITVNSDTKTPVIIDGAHSENDITWFVDLYDMAGSTYSYSVVAKDMNGASVSGNYSGIIGTDITVLPSGSKLTGSAEDDDSFDVNSFSLFQNGSDFSDSIVAGSNSVYVPWSYTLPGADNLYFYELNGTDTTLAAIPVNWSKYEGETLKSLVLKDSGSPVITIDSPSQGAYLKGSVITSGNAYDDLAINSLKITAVQSDNVTMVDLTSDPGVALDTTEGSGEYYYDTAAKKWVWNFALERLPDAYENDSITLVYEAEDIAGNTTTSERFITIDTVDPLVSINSPGDGDIVNGNVTFQGVVADAKLSLVEIKLGTNGYETMSGGYNWSKDVSSTTLISYATDLGDGTYELPVIVRATDSAGNIGLDSENPAQSGSYSIIINPDTDKPIVNMTSPSNNSTLGGAILLIGSATDDDAVNNVELRIDFNGDGDFNDILDLNDDGDTDDDFETESSWVGSSYFNNGVWRHEINSLGELYKSNVDSVDDVLDGNETIDNGATGSITVQIHAWDINLIESIVTSLNITLDETFPDINNFSVTGDPSAISGTFNLEWDVSDNEEITSIAISYDGGLTYTDTIYDGSGTISAHADSKTIDTGADLGLAGLSSTVNVRMKVVDNTGYQSFSNLTLNIDNIYPAGIYTGRIEEIGDGVVCVAGNAEDTGAVRGIDKIELYIIQDGEILEPEGVGKLAPESIDFGDGNGIVNYTTNLDYKIVIDNDEASEFPDADGYEEYMSINGNSIDWQAEFDSTSIDNSNPLQVHFVIWDNAGNATHYVETMMMVGTDLDADGSVEPDEMVAYPIGFKATGLLQVEMDPGSNTDLYLYIEHNSSTETDTNTGDGSMTYTIDISDAGDYPEGNTTFDIQVRDSANGDAVIIQKILTVEIIGEDTTPPEVTLYELTQNSVLDGHLETNSSFNGSDFDVSGSVTFSALASDNNRIQTINMIVETSDDTVISNVEIASWNGGLFEAKNGAVFSQNELNWEDGHQVAWTIDWDSASITGTADLDVEVRFVATDFKALAGEDSDTFDVVPFISSLDRGTSFNTNRSKYGYYALRRGTDNSTAGLEGDTIRIYGYNMFDSTSDTITFGSGSTSVNLAGPGGNSYLTVEVPTDATSGALTLTVNGLDSINNQNSNNESYHSEASAYIPGSENWTDDRFVHIWQSVNNTGVANSGSFEGSADPIYPAMTIDEGTGILYGSWSNYSISDVLYGPNNGSAETQVFSSYDPLEHTDIDFGTRATIVYNANTYGNNNWNERGAGGVHVWDNQVSKNSDGGDGNNYNSEELYHDEMLMQFINQRIVNDGDNIHISYFDTDTKAVKYQYFLSGNTVEGEVQDWINLDGGYDGDDGTRIVDKDGSSRSSAVGEYSAIDVMTNGNPVVAYYDTTNQTLKLAVATANDPTNAQWTLQTVMDSEDPNYQYSGKYVSIRIDSNNDIHMVFYQNSMGNLIYMKSTADPIHDGAYVFSDSIIIDSIGSVGAWADLTLDDSDNPVISYLDSSRADTFDGLKMAYYNSVKADWEYMNVPLGFEISSSRTSVEYDIRTTGDGDTWDWETAIGYSSSDLYRIAYYIPE